MKKQEKNMDFAAKIVRLRLNMPLRNAKPVQIKDAAEESDVNIGSYSQAENGIVPGKAVLNKLAKYFNVSVEYLIEYIKNGDDDTYRGDPVSMVAPVSPGGGAGISEKDGLFGKTRQIEKEGGHFAITEFEPSGETDPFGQASIGLREIFDSRDPIIIPALQANIRAFQIAARREKQIKLQADQISELKEENNEIKERLETLERKLSTAGDLQKSTAT